MGTVDKRRSRPRDMLLRRSVSSSSIVKAASKVNLPQHSNTDLLPHSYHTTAAARMSLLHAMPPPPLLEGSERFICEDVQDIIEKRRQQQQSPGSSTSSKKGRVSFSTKSKCNYIDQRTPEEKNASFYSKTEYKRIYTENIETIKRMEKEKKLPASETQYYRGLFVARARFEREQRIKFVVSKILREQERNETLSEDWVNDFSKKFSSQTTIAAFYLGKIDAIAASNDAPLSSRRSSLHVPAKAARPNTTRRMTSF
ncbi:MAG: hypothetical protein SGBAC_007595 [Bacillariaceae sp.]